jgi:hypothetical protein
VLALWRKGASLIVLAVFIGLPLSGLVCAIDCAAEARSTPVAVDRHAVPASCHEESGAATIEGVTDHDCDHGALVAAAFLTTVRADTTILSVKDAIVVTQRTALTAFACHAQPRSGAPPGAAPPVRTPLVLRI